MVVGSHVSKLYDGMKNECRPLDVTLSNGSISYRVKNLFFISSSRVNKNNEAGTKKGFLSGDSVCPLIDTLPSTTNFFSTLKLKKRSFSLRFCIHFIFVEFATRANF